MHHIQFAKPSAAHFIAFGLISCLLLPISPKAETSPNAAVQFHIPKQKLIPALTDFAEQSGVQLLYNAELAEALSTSGINGSYAPQQALSSLLKGSGIGYRYVDKNIITLERQPKGNINGSALLPVAQVAADSTKDNGEGQVMPKVTVEADADPNWQTDPYNTDYVLPNATSGTKTDTPVMETPVNVQSVSKQALKDQQAISLDKALRNVSGVTTSKNNLGSETYYLRGFQSNALFRNGFRQDTGISSFGQSAFGGIGQQFANIEGVEVLKGPAAILYGRVEPGGMVNVITKMPKDTPYYALQQQFGSYSLFRTSMDATGPLTENKDLLYRFNASFQDNNSFRDLVNNENVFLAPVLRWNITPKTQATLQLEYQHQNASQDQQVLPFDPKTNRIIDLPHHLNYGERNPVETETHFVGFDWKHQFNDDWSIKQGVNYKSIHSNLGLTAVPQFFDIGNNQVGRQTTNGFSTLDTLSTNLDLAGHFDTWGLRHTLLMGGDYYNFESTSGQAFGNDSFNAPYSFIGLDNPVHPGKGLFVDQSTFSSFRQAVDNFGAYFQDQVKLPYNIHVLGGFRYQYVHSKLLQSDANESFTQLVPDTVQTDDAVTPRFGLLWQPKNWLSLYGNYVENFGANTGAFGFNGNGNPPKPLPPQSAQQFEIGAKFEFFDGRFRATLDYYDITKQNVATGDPDKTHSCRGTPGDCSALLGEVRSRGPEVDIQGEILPGWNVIATYTNQDVRVTKGSDTTGGNFGGVEIPAGGRLQFTPRNIGSFWTTYEFQQGDFKGLKFGGGVNMQDGMVDASNKAKSPGYALVSLLAGYSFEIGKAKLTAQLNIDNLLDKDYVTNIAPNTANNPIAFVNFSTPRTFMGSINVEY
ncbi:MAG: TonB-dependent receptor [Methyloglobulus sp.]|nr:TonB-dependent receptor [Methyloglobulus sp.]